jgi:uncharacterized protein YqgQ
MDNSNYSKLPPDEIAYNTEDLQIEMLPSEASTLLKSEMMQREDDECYEENNNEIIRSQRRGAGILCGFLGCFIGGPIVAVAVVAGVCAAHATQWCSWRYCASLWRCGSFHQRSGQANQ